MTITPEMLTKAILEIRDDLVASGEFESFAAINAGYCTDFVHDVYQRFGKSAYEYLEELGIDNFMQPPEDDDGFNDGYPLDRELLQEHWPAIQPTHGLTWDQLDELSGDAGFNAGTHVWIHLDDRFYDAEAPEGVENFFELPFFQRVISGWIAEKGIKLSSTV